MSQYERVLDTVEQHLIALKARGVRFLTVESSTLAALAEKGTLIEDSPAFPADSNQGNNRIFPTSRPSARNGGSGVLELAGKAEESEPTLQPAQTPTPGLHGMLSYDHMPNGDGMEGLRDRALACLKCPHLVKSRKNVVFGVGDIHAQLMFVGEAPGADEDAQGEPFVGAAGQLLTKIINTMGLSRETVYIANILKCRPDTPGQSAGNRKPTPDEMKTCLPYLLAQIDLIQPKVLVALGATAIEGLLGKGDGIGKLRGKFQVFRDIPLMPTFHPAYLLRNQALSEKRKVWEDMLRVMERLEMPVSEKQKGYFLKP